MNGPAAAAALVGDEPTARAGELDQIACRLQVGNAVLIEGDAGIGKTTVWRAAVAIARGHGFRVLEAAPAVAEQTLSYAVLGDLLEAVGQDTVTMLVVPQRRALQQVMLQADGDEAADPRLVAVALRSALASLAELAPVVVAIDDAEWTDAASAAALDFALRRAPGIRLLMAVRKGRRPPIRLPTETLEIRPLSATAIYRLLVDRLGVHLSRTSLLRIHAASGGNPFYAIELARANPTDGELVLPASLNELVTDRLRTLPRTTQHALAELALAGSAPPGASLDDAVRAGVVLRSEGTVRFAHPLFADAALALFDEREREELHRQISAWHPSLEQRVRHLARATRAPNEAMAATVAAVAATATRRGTFAAAAELWDLAAQLTDASRLTSWAEREVEAGLAHLLAGNPAAGVERLERNLDRLERGPLRQRGLLGLATRLGRHSADAPIPLLERALSEADDARLRGQIFHLLTIQLNSSGDFEGAADVARNYLSQAESADDEELANALMIAANAELFCERPPWELIRRAQALRHAHPEEGRHGPWLPVSFLGFALLREDRIDEARTVFERELADFRERGSAGQLAGRLAALSYAEAAAARWTTVRSYADELIVLAEQIGAPSMLCDGLCLGATATGLSGDVERARTEATRALTLAESIHLVPSTIEARSILGLLALSLGRPHEAAATCREVPTASWRRWNPVAGGRGTIDAVEVFVSVGELERATAVAATLPADARELPAARALLAAASGDVAAAIAHLRSAAPAPSPFRRARELLLLGRLLRQARRRKEARATLEQARDDFERIGTPLWVERAEEEIARLGHHAPASGVLTASERRVAELVVAGLSNKEIAARLVVTVRTVEAHLSKVYAKLDIDSRTALVSRWPALEAAPASPAVVDIVDFRNGRRRLPSPTLGSETA